MSVLRGGDVAPMRARLESPRLTYLYFLPRVPAYAALWRTGRVQAMPASENCNESSPSLICRRDVAARVSAVPLLAHRPTPSDRGSGGPCPPRGPGDTRQSFVQKSSLFALASGES